MWMAIVIVLLCGAVGYGGWVMYKAQTKPVVAVAPEVEESAPKPAETERKKEPESAKHVAEAAPKPEPLPKPEPKAEPAPAPKMAETPPPPAPTGDEAKFAAIFAGTLKLDEREGAKPESLAQAKAAFDSAMAHGKQAEWSAMLRRSLLASLKTVGPSSVTPQGLAALSRSPAFVLALEQSAFLATVPPGALLEPKKAPDTGGETSESPGQEHELRLFHEWVLSTPAAMEAWLLTVRPADNTAKALAQWSTLAQADPAAKEKYMNLALACSLVFEEPRKVEWNGSQTITLSADQRYAYYTKHAAKGDLAVNPDKLSARDLVWTVAAPIPESELEWALKKMNLRQKTWGNAYGSIVYDMERAVKDTNKYDEYTFAEIQKKGGICGDQAYYTAYTARAVGIPAAIVSGDGSRGPHAWATWLSEDNQWSFAGRFGGYPLGHVSNPQTGNDESEHEFIRRSNRNASDEALLRGMRAVWLAQAMEIEGAVDMAGAIYEGASVLGADVPAIWKAKLAFWSAHRSDASLDQWRAFLDLLKRQMKDDVALLAEARTAEEKYVFPRQDSKLAMKELKKDVRKLDRSDSAANVDQADQIAKVLKQQAAVLEKSGLDGVRGLYDKSYREHGRNPAVFKLLAADCWSFVKGDTEVAKKACRDMESSFKRYIDSGGDYFDVTSQMSVLSLISSCYREIGEEKKAESLAKDVEKANAKASRNAL
jgi:hypothetical protein